MLGQVEVEVTYDDQSTKICLKVITTAVCIELDEKKIGRY